jgi:integrase
MKRTQGFLERRGKMYYAIWNHEGKRYVVSTGHRNLKDARGRLAELVAPFHAQNEAAIFQSISGRLDGSKVEAARLLDEANPPLRIADAWRAFKECKNRPDSGPATLRQYESEWDRFENWVSAKHKDIVYMREVSPEIAGEYAGDLGAAKVSASTYNQHVRFLCMAWRVLSKQTRATVNPWDKDGITRLELKKLATRKHAVTPAQFDALLSATENDQDLHDLFTLLAWTGLRLADAVCMIWGAVDFKRNVITLAPQKTERRQGKQVHIPMFPAVVEILNRRQAGLVLDPTGQVFTDLCSEYQHDRSALSKRITAAFDRAGMTTNCEREDRTRNPVVFGAHSLRHYFVTVASAAGMPAAMIKSITGHDTDEMLEHYQQLSADMAADMAKRIHDKPPALLAGESGAPALPDTISVKRDALQAILDALDGKDTKTARKLLSAILKGDAK